LNVAAHFAKSYLNKTPEEAKRMPVNVIRMNEGWRMDEGQFLDQAPTVVLPAPPPPVQIKKGKAMDYIPRQRDTRYRWYKNLSGNVVAEAVKMGAVAGDATAIKAVADGIIARMDATDAAQEAVDSARTLEQNTEAAGLLQIRAKVKNWKTLANYASSGSEDVLQMRGTDSGFDPASYKTTLKVSLVPGGVRVDFTKKGATAVNIYMRVRGTANWRKIGMDTESPYTDTTPLAQAGAPEVREYMGRGVLHDEEIGQDSDVVSCTFAG
jgi:hypothetical protein